MSSSGVNYGWLQSSNLQNKFSIFFSFCFVNKALFLDFKIVKINNHNQNCMVFLLVYHLIYTYFTKYNTEILYFKNFKITFYFFIIFAKMRLLLKFLLFYNLQSNCFSDSPTASKDYANEKCPKCVPLPEGFLRMIYLSRPLSSYENNDYFVYKCKFHSFNFSND